MSTVTYVNRQFHNYPEGTKLWIVIGIIDCDREIIEACYKTRKACNGFIARVKGSTKDMEIVQATADANGNFVVETI